MPSVYVKPVWSGSNYDDDVFPGLIKDMHFRHFTINKVINLYNLSTIE